MPEQGTEKGEGGTDASITGRVVICKGCKDESCGISGDVSTVHYLLWADDGPTKFKEQRNEKCVFVKQWSTISYLRTESVS